MSQSHRAFPMLLSIAFDRAPLGPLLTSDPRYQSRAEWSECRLYSRRRWTPPMQPKADSYPLLSRQRPQGKLELKSLRRNQHQQRSYATPWLLLLPLRCLRLLSGDQNSAGNRGLTRPDLGRSVWSDVISPKRIAKSYIQL